MAHLDLKVNRNPGVSGVVYSSKPGSVMNLGSTEALYSPVQ